MERQFQGNSRLHLALNTNQLEKSIEFYEHLFNQKATKIKPGYAKFEVEEPRINMTINETSQVSGNQLSHLGIEVKSSEEVTEQLHRMKNLGHQTSYEENTSCCYADQDKVWVTDPNGNSWEVFFAFDDSEHRSDPSNNSTCCTGIEDNVESCC